MNKMGGLARNLRGSAELLALEESSIPIAVLGEWIRVSASQPLCCTAQNAQDISQAYCEELQLKQSILEDILRQTNRDTLTVYLSCWLHEPCLTETVKEKLETLIIHAIN